MGFFFTNGETKKRPGIYQRYKNVGSPSVAGASNGIAAITVRASWGPTGKVITVSSYDEAVSVFGSGGTVSLIQEVFAGGASTVHVVRLGGETTKGMATLTDTAASPQEAVKVTAKYGGARAFRYMVRKALGDEATKEFVVYENGVLLEKLSFAADSTAEPANLVEAGKKSQYFDFTAVEGASGTVLALVPETDFPVGTDPTITNADYSNAFALLEPYSFNTVAVDTIETTVHLLAANYVRRVYDTGKLCFAVVGEPVSVSFDTRCDHARAFNDYRVIYVGGGVRSSSGAAVEGAGAAARIAGMAAAVPSNESLTHTVVSGAVEVLERLTYTQYEKTIDSGMLTFSSSSKGAVWVESGITTLISPSGEEDEGWKKIKRVKVRWELMDRVSATTEPLIGRISNNADGQATVLQAVQSVLNTMVAEEKLMAGATVSVDKTNPPVGDSAWFIIQADDLDAMEKLYFVYQFRYSSVS